jgi:dipeptidyl aminopeptidase/acylaminoacyl peptidase
MQDLDLSEPAYDSNDLLFSTRDEWTEDRGFARWTQRGGYDELVSVGRYFSMITRADSSDAVVYRREAKTDAPDVFVSNGRFGSPRLVLQSNPFMDEYAWPTTELVEYVNAEGKRLHGTLIYPANHDPSRRYPMIVYAYELLTPQTHRWVNPSERSYYNQITWAHEGYFVLLPDIVFRGRDPGVSLAETMDAAISAVDAKGVINRDQVGFVGHSWGGYHGAYLGARTSLFAATVAGAPLTDFVSFMGQFHWNGGNPESGHWETGQARMAVPYWDDPASHERNSPLHGVQDMTTPILMAHGDSDGVVEYFQSTVFYNFVRRAGKEMVLLTYEGEDHGFRQKANQIDYHRRILEWFDHHLRGNDAQTWVTEGVLWKDHDEEKKRVAKKSGGA